MTSSLVLQGSPDEKTRAFWTVMFKQNTYGITNFEKKKFNMLSANEVLKGFMLSLMSVRRADGRVGRRAGATLSFPEQNSNALPLTKFCTVILYIA